MRKPKPSKDTKPKPKRPREDGGHWCKAFLAMLKETANVRLACEEAKVCRAVAYEYRNRHEVFRKKWDEAVEEAVDHLEAVARLRAERSSDTLLIFLLKCHRPDKYGDHVKIDHVMKAEVSKFIEELRTSLDPATFERVLDAVANLNPAQS